MKQIKRKTLSFMFLLAMCTLWQHAPAQVKMDYHVKIDTTSHYLNVTLCATHVSQPEVLLKMPVWAPGYYEILNFPRNLANFAVTTPQGKPVPWTKQEKNGWRIQSDGQDTLLVTYRIWAQLESLVESNITPEKAFVAPNGTFMYVEGEKEQPVSITYEFPQSWKKVCTGLESNTNPRHTWKEKQEHGTRLCHFRACDFDRLYDCPLYMGNPYTIDFTIDDCTYQLCLETPDGIEHTSFVNDVKKMIKSTITVMGNRRHFNHYCFILLGKGQGGLEHLNSQACFTEGSFHFATREDYVDFILFISHEFFHSYNVKTIRPIELGPFDYDKEVYCPTLWVSEGITCYYEMKNLIHAGVITRDEMLHSMSYFLGRTMKHTGHKYQTLRECSYDIWINFLSPNANEEDVRINYYFKGPWVGWFLDLAIQHESKGRKSLDNVMHFLYDEYYLKQKRGFTEDEFWAACEKMAGAPLPDIKKMANTTDDIDFDKYLSMAGCKLSDGWKIVKK